MTTKKSIRSIKHNFLLQVKFKIEIYIMCVYKLIISLRQCTEQDTTM